MRGTWSLVSLFVAALFFAGCATVASGPPPSAFNGAMSLPDGHTRTLRSSTFDRTGGNMDMRVVQPGETLPLLEAEGAGCVRHIYWTYILVQPEARAQLFRNFILRMYWDGEQSPSVETPLGDFFGVCGGQPRPMRSLGLTVNPGGLEQPDTSWGFNCYFPMPFSNGARIELTNEGDTGIAVWVHVDHELYDRTPAWMARAGRFHASFNRRNPTTPTLDTGINLDGAENYVILDTEGRGALAGYVVTVDNRKGGWWGEGDDMVFVDGERWPPSYHGTGSEEIFGGGACPNVEYTNPYTGFHLVENAYGDPWYGKNGLYRLFVHDPIRFQEHLRVTLEHGHANDLANDYSSVAFWYQQEPHAPFAPLPPPEARLPLPPPPEPFHVPGATEGEDLVEEAVASEGDALAAVPFAGEFSRRRFLWLVPNATGDYVTVPFEVRRDGRYAISLYLVAATDFCILQSEIDGKAVGDPIDAYNGTGGVGTTHVIPTGERKLPATKLRAGSHVLTLRVVGRHPEAVGWMIGLDCFKVTPVE